MQSGAFKRNCMLCVQFCPEDGVCHTKFSMQSSVSIVTRLRAEQPGNGDSVAGIGKTFVFPLYSPDRVWSPPSLPVMEFCGLFPGFKAAGA